jgi:hypothetical protein
MTKALEEPPRRADTGSRTDNPTRVERLQQDMLACLRKPGHDPISYAGLAYCGPQGRGRVGCSEACWYGNRRRLRSEFKPSMTCYQRPTNLSARLESFPACGPSLSGNSMSLIFPPSSA